jgi:hypothetical protein
MVELMGEVRRLHEAGALIPEGQSPPALAAGGFGAALEHIAMLNDRTRTEAYLKAIGEIVRPGDVVVDIGTGTGILAMAAARAGAARVYAIEAGRMGPAARSLFGANGYGKNITLIEGWSTKVELPERADVLVSEIIGNEPLAENILITTADARARLLKPDALIVPGRLKVYGLPVTLDGARLEANMFGKRALDKWKSWCGFDFGNLARFTAAESSRFYIKPQAARDWPMLAPPILLADLNLTELSEVVENSPVCVTMTASGTWNGLIVYFEVQLSPGVALSTYPPDVSDGNHWRCPVWIMADAPDVQAGEAYRLSHDFGRGNRPARLSLERA